MLPANAMGSGQEIHPTNMMTTPVGAPVVGANLAMNALRAPPCPTILVTCQPALNMASVAPVTVSVPPMLPPCLPSMHVMGYPTILLLGLPATQLTSPSIGNGGCAPVGATLVPNVTNVFYAYARSHGRTTGDEADVADPAMTLAELRSLGRALSGPDVESALLDGGVGRLRISCFSPRVPSRVFHAMRTLSLRGMTALLIDLRGNGGGELESFAHLAGDFLQDGALLATMTDSDGDEVELRARSSRDYALPVALRVDAATASAAELFAGCLQAHGRAVVVGERTYGKGEAKTVVARPDGTLAYDSVVTLTLPGGRRVHGRGVEPDLAAPSADDVETWRAMADRLLPALRDAIARAILGERAGEDRSSPEETKPRNERTRP